MKLSEFQDRVDPDRKFPLMLLRAYIMDGLREIQLITDENVARAVTNMVAGQREYDIPASCVRIRAIRVKDEENSKYYAIPRLIGAATDEVST